MDMPMGLRWMVLVCSLVVGPRLFADYLLSQPAPTEVRLKRGFWFDRLETNRLVTAEACWSNCYYGARIANFTNAANRAFGTFKGIPFDDSDVYKVMEGVAYIQAAHPDPKWEERMTWLIGEIARAQEPDGYLYTARTLGFAGQVADSTNDWHRWMGKMMGPVRWSNVSLSHELYNVGHLYEAAVAWRLATGRDDLLKVAVRSADLVERTIGPGETQLHLSAGHEEIELALAKLYRLTGAVRYLKLAKYLLDVKGSGACAADGVFSQDGSETAREDKYLAWAYCQNHAPVVEQTEAVGHAVRAGYLYCGMCDVAALTGDKDYRRALDALWQDVVSGKMALTGGLGTNPNGEEIGARYELPNDYGETYLETCAAIGNALWNERMFRATGDAKYVDVLERVLYNGFLSGISLSGDEFFYPNPLAVSTNRYQRSKWFGCSCCPVNDVRFLPQVPAMAYATDGTNLYWNLFMSGSATVAGHRLAVETDYPWAGTAAMTVTPSSPGAEFTLFVRIPGWARGRPVPSDLYTQLQPASAMAVELSVNGRAVNGAVDAHGFIAVRRAWQAGDVVRLMLPFEVQRIRAHDKVAADRGRLAVERGPIVYCAEGCDNGGRAYAATLPADATFTEVGLRFGDRTFPGLKASNGLVLVPYCLWDNREPGNELQTWFNDCDSAK